MVTVGVKGLPLSSLSVASHLYPGEAGARQ